jgi:hypothetical protein
MLIAAILYSVTFLPNAILEFLNPVIRALAVTGSRGLAIKLPMVNKPLRLVAK